MGRAVQCGISLERKGEAMMVARTMLGAVVATALRWQIEMVVGHPANCSGGCPPRAEASMWSDSSLRSPLIG